jgi:hypothetical protein
MHHPTCQIPAIPKICTRDTIITTTNGVGEMKAMPVQKGTYIVLDAPAVHYNRRYKFKNILTVNFIRSLQPGIGKTRTILSRKGS